MYRTERLSIYFIFLFISSWYAIFYIIYMLKLNLLSKLKYKIILVFISLQMKFFLD